MYNLLNDLLMAKERKIFKIRSNEKGYFRFNGENNLAMMNFDLKKTGGLVGIYILGATFALYIAAMIIAIVGHQSTPAVAVVLFDVAFWLVLVGAIFLVLGVLLLALNMRAAASSDIKMDPNTRMIVIGLILLSFASAFLYAVVPTFV